MDRTLVEPNLGRIVRSRRRRYSLSVLGESGADACSSHWAARSPKAPSTAACELAPVSSRSRLRASSARRLGPRNVRVSTAS